MKIKTNKNVIAQIRIISANNDPQLMQKIIDLFNESGWSKHPRDIKKWMVDELDKSPEEAENLISEYSKHLAAKGRDQATQKRKERLQDAKERALQPLPLPPLTQYKGSSYKSRISLMAKDRLFRKRYSSTDPKSSTFNEKVDMILDYVEKFPSAASAAQALINEAQKLLQILSSKNDQSISATSSLAKRAISVSGVVAKVNSFLWVLTALMMYGAVGTSDYVSRYGNAGGADEVKAFLVFLTSLGSAILSSVLYKFIMDRKSQSKTPKRLYEGFNK